MLDEGMQIRFDTAYNFVQGLEGDPNRICFLACAQNSPFEEANPVGVVVGIWHSEEAQPCYEVRNLYVVPEYRGKGVAKRLMKALLDWAYEDNAPIYITTEGQPRPFYRALGFEPVREICGSTLATIRERLGGTDVSTESIQSG